MANKKSPLDYTYAVGNIRALERFLIKEEVFRQAVESGLQEALRLFVESAFYSEELLHIRDSRDLEAVLSQESAKLKKLTANLLADKEFICLLEADDIVKMQAAGRKLGSSFLEDYLKYLTDMHNIKSFLRLFILKEPRAALKNRLVDGGLIPREEFIKFYDKDLSFFINRLRYVHKGVGMIDYADYLAGAIQNTQANRSFVALEKAINSFLIRVLTPAKYITFGPEPVLAYYFAKLNEINLIRLVILAKLNNLTQDLLRERLNEVYA